MRFTRILLRNWRNFGSLEVPLQQRGFVVGPNASGKSNLLDAFRFLHDLVAVGGGFTHAVSKRGGVSRVRSLAARKEPEIEVSVHIGDDKVADAWAYDLSFSQDIRKQPIIRRERVLRRGKLVFERPLPEDKDDPRRLAQTYLEQLNVNREYRPVADFFSSIRYLHIVPQLVREPDRSVGRRNDPFGGDFLEQVASTTKKTQRGRLAQIQKTLRIAVPQLSKVEVWKDSRGTPHLRGKYRHWRPQGAWQTEGDFSDGTLRLMGLLWAILDGRGPLLLEEPELSLHPFVVRFLPQMFSRMQRKSGRQIFVSTHSPELLLDEGIGLDEVLLLKPASEGTTVQLAGNLIDVRVLLQGGMKLPDVVMPRTSPEGAEQLTLFGQD